MKPRRKAAWKTGQEAAEHAQLSEESVDRITSYENPGDGWIISARWREDGAGQRIVEFVSPPEILPR